MRITNDELFQLLMENTTISPAEYMVNLLKSRDCIFEHNKQYYLKEFETLLDESLQV